MRDPKRIDKVLNIIRMFWKQEPDLRLMQLLMNALGPGDPFHVEDDVLVKKLDEYMGIIEGASSDKYAEGMDE
jgi:uncharacterized protein YihD (DUF1040 family)